MNIIDTYTKISDEVSRIAASAGRRGDDITIIAVSKTHPAPLLQEAIDAGIRILGENKVQEAKQKHPLLTGDFEFHLIGHLQSNKARDAVRLFSLIHSIDKTGTAREVDKEAGKIGKRQNVLLQVNTSGEETKSGVEPDEAFALAREITQLEHVELCGLMTIGANTDNEEEIRRCFRLLRELRDHINRTVYAGATALSMGMSSDYRIAVEEGATMLRIGTALFGGRIYQ